MSEVRPNDGDHIKASGGKGFEDAGGPADRVTPTKCDNHSSTRLTDFPGPQAREFEFSPKKCEAGPDKSCDAWTILISIRVDVLVDDNVHTPPNQPSIVNRRQYDWCGDEAERPRRRGGVEIDNIGGLVAEG